MYEYNDPVAINRRAKVITQRPMQITMTAVSSEEVQAVGPAADNISTGKSAIPTAGMKEDNDSETSGPLPRCPVSRFASGKGSFRCDGCELRGGEGLAMMDS
jgi:hypothetical protein